MKYKCKICKYLYDENTENVKFENLPLAWKCKDCGVPKTYFQLIKQKKIKKNLGEIVKTNQHENTIHIEVDKNSVSLQRDENLCIYCGNCKNICKKQGICENPEIKNIKTKNVCIDCGQCTLVCPTGAIDVKNDILLVKSALADKNKIVIFQTAPAVRVAFGDAFGLKFGQTCEGKVVSALRKLGGKYIFDTTFGADLTVMEEASELLLRLNENGRLPLFTSCCPAWVKYLEIFHSEFISNLSTTKSPILMQGAMIKTYFAKKMGINPIDIVSVAITPCSAKKAEIKRSEMNASANFNNQPSMRDIDYVLTVRELIQWIKEEKINFSTLAESKYDEPFANASGGGVIFGNSGGVMESALRTAYFLETGKYLEKLQFETTLGNECIKTAEVLFGKKRLKVAVVSGIKNVKNLLSEIKSGNDFDFIEVMACPDGCISGGGQPKARQGRLSEIYQCRKQGLYKLDKKTKIKVACDNDEIKKIYANFLSKPLSNLSITLLHTSDIDRSENLEK